jgi:hypothetical protein
MIGDTKTLAVAADAASAPTRNPRLLVFHFDVVFEVGIAALSGGSDSATESFSIV